MKFLILPVILLLAACGGGSSAKSDESPDSEMPVMKFDENRFGESRLG